DDDVVRSLIDIAPCRSHDQTSADPARLETGPPHGKPVLLRHLLRTELDRIRAEYRGEQLAHPLESCLGLLHGQDVRDERVATILDGGTAAREEPLGEKTCQLLRG